MIGLIARLFEQLSTTRRRFRRGPGGHSTTARRALRRERARELLVYR